jgi:hypothetical protein
MPSPSSHFSSSQNDQSIVHHTAWDTLNMVAESTSLLPWEENVRQNKKTKKKERTKIESKDERNIRHNASPEKKDFRIVQNGMAIEWIDEHSPAKETTHQYSPSWWTQSTQKHTFPSLPCQQNTPSPLSPLSLLTLR